MEVRQITVEEFFAHPDAPALLAAYARESSIGGLPPARPDETMYQLLEGTGRFRVFAAMADAALLGFVTLLVSNNPHYSAVIGVSESLFVAPEHRNTGAGMALIRQAKAAAREAGAAGFLMSAPSGGQLAQVLERMDCHETNRVFFWGLA